jgi:DNA helicase-2/ATP-dependent DNA helicase PcrA
VHGEGSAIRSAVTHVYRLSDSHALRAWAQDALEGSNPDSDRDDITAEAEVGRAVLEFLRTNPTGDGAGLRAWVDATDPFGATVAGVELLTFHAAKGREWHSVVLVGCETSLVPHRSATTAAGRAEEARLLYVAITRATDHLTVTWARRRGGYQRRITPLLDGFVSTVAPLTARPQTVEVGERPHRDITIEQLRAWRTAVARAGNVLPEMICTDVTLAMIAESKPGSPEALEAATGIGLLTARRLFPGIAAALEDSGHARSTITGA